MSYNTIVLQTLQSGISVKRSVEKGIRKHLTHVNNFNILFKN